MNETRDSFQQKATMEPLAMANQSDQTKTIAVDRQTRQVADRCRV